MKTFPRLPLPLVFSLFLLVGLVAGSTVGRATRALASESPQPKAWKSLSETPVEITTGQRNILVMLVDRLDAQSPQLEGIWLVLYVPPSPGITLLPVYPAPSGTGSGHDLVERFKLGDDLAPDPSFLAAVQSQDIWWNNYLVLDKLALAEVIDIAGGLSSDGSKINGVQSIAALPAAAEDPQAALRSQHTLLNGLCHYRGGQNASSVDPLQVFNLLSNHFRTDLEPGKIIAEWKEIQVSKGQLCSFPTLASPLPAFESSQAGSRTAVLVIDAD